LLPRTLGLAGEVWGKILIGQDFWSGKSGMKSLIDRLRRRDDVRQCNVD
jgi:hypothetical protein